jgi:predicted nucleotidyltransferase component of viral defense system
MAISELENFLLVGGTALSLHYGHRFSVDLDFFSSENFDNDSIISVLEKKNKDFIYRNNDNVIGLFGYIDDVKVDFVKHRHHPLIAAPLVTEGIRLISIPDIIAMKINAIMNGGVKKDFWDVAELLQHYSIEDFIIFHEKKHQNQQLLISVPQAITYFDDAGESEDPISLKGQTWQTVKKFIQQKVSDYLR